MYAQIFGTALQDEGELVVALLEDCRSTVTAAINDAVESTSGYVERSRWNEWLNEKCRAEKNAALLETLQQETRQNVINRSRSIRPTSYGRKKTAVW